MFFASSAFCSAPPIRSSAVAAGHPCARTGPRPCRSSARAPAPAQASQAHALNRFPDGFVPVAGTPRRARVTHSSRTYPHARAQRVAADAQRVTAVSPRACSACVARARRTTPRAAPRANVGTSDSCPAGGTRPRLQRHVFLRVCDCESQKLANVVQVVPKVNYYLMAS